MNFLLRARLTGTCVVRATLLVACLLSVAVPVRAQRVVPAFAQPFAQRVASPEVVKYATRWGFEVHPNSWDPVSLDGVAKTGATFVRMDLARDWVIQPDGTFDWSIYDAFVTAAHANGLGILFIGPYLYAGFSSPSQYVAFLTAAATRYAGRNIMYELGPNEPDAPQNGIWLTPAQYAALAIPAADAIKRIDPTALTISAGPVTFDFPWDSALAAAGVQKHVDAIGTHLYYTTPAALRADLVELSAIFGGTRPVYVTEFGATSGSLSVQMMQAAQGHVPLYNVYEYQDETSGDGFGMLTFTGTPRPVLAQVEAIMREPSRCIASYRERGPSDRCPRIFPTR